MTSRKVHGIKRANVEVEFDAKKARELMRSAQDPIYFIKNFVKIRHPTLGIVPFELYPYQEELIKMIHENRWSIILSARQTGKCCFFATTINIRKAKTSFFPKLMLGFFKFMEKQKWSKKKDIVSFVIQ